MAKKRRIHTIGYEFDAFHAFAKQEIPMIASPDNHGIGTAKCCFLGSPDQGQLEWCVFSGGLREVKCAVAGIHDDCASQQRF